MAHEEDAEDEVKWAEKVICNFGVYAGTPLGEMMQDVYKRQVLKGVMRLCDIWIEHPANAMAGIMKQAGFGKKLLAETVEQFKATTGNEPVSYTHLHFGIIRL